MASDILVKLPQRRYRLPRALDRRLHWLLDRNNRGEITSAERQEAEGLASVAQLFTLLNHRVERARRESQRTHKGRGIAANSVRRTKVFEWRDVRIVGRSPTGRATVAALKMNHPDALTIRRDQQALGRHPR